MYIYLYISEDFFPQQPDPRGNTLFGMVFVAFWKRASHTLNSKPMWYMQTHIYIYHIVAIYIYIYIYYTVLSSQ